MDETLRQIALDAPYIEQANLMHLRILEAIEAGDPDAARRSKRISVNFAARSSRRGAIYERFGSRRGKPCLAVCRPPMRPSREWIDEDDRTDQMM